MQKNGTGLRPFHRKYMDVTRETVCKGMSAFHFQRLFYGLFCMITGCYFNDVHRFILRAEKTSSAGIAGFVC